MNAYLITIKSSTVHPNPCRRSSGETTYAVIASSYSDAEHNAPNNSRDIHSIKLIGEIIHRNIDESEKQ